jgi:hypothetical protein
MWTPLGKETIIPFKLEVDGNHLFKLHDVADEFSKHFQSVYNNPTILSPSEFLPFSWSQNR